MSVSAERLGVALKQLEAISTAPWLLRGLTDQKGLTLTELYEQVSARIKREADARYQYSYRKSIVGVFRVIDGWKYFVKLSDSQSDKFLEEWVTKVFTATKTTEVPKNWDSLPMSQHTLS